MSSRIHHRRQPDAIVRHRRHTAEPIIVFGHLLHHVPNGGQAAHQVFVESDVIIDLHGRQLMVQPWFIDGVRQRFVEQQMADNGLKKRIRIYNSSVGYIQRKVNTNATDEVILGPPAAPTTIRTSPSGFTIMVGLIDDIGRLPGSM